MGQAPIEPFDAAAERKKAEIAAEFKSLELLFEYTKFHIGAYLTLTGAYLTLANFKTGALPKPFLCADHLFMILAVAFFAVAGFAGGVIVSSITQWKGGSATDFLDDENKLGPWNTHWLTGRTWTWVEHTTFWAGLVCAVLSVLLKL